MRILALDVGKKSCGIALSDRLQITAQGCKSFYFSSQDWTALVSHLKINYLSRVELIVVGLPLLPSGAKSKTTLMIEAFARKLRSETQVPVTFAEEYKTTRAAHDVMITAGLSRGKRKKHVDQIAAVLILQNYLATKSREAGRPL